MARARSLARLPRSWANCDPRPVRALEASQLLVVPVNQLGVLGKLQAPFMRVIVRALHDRAGLSATEISALAGTWGVEVPNLAKLLKDDDRQP